MQRSHRSLRALVVVAAISGACGAPPAVTPPIVLPDGGRREDAAAQIDAFVETDASDGTCGSSRGDPLSIHWAPIPASCLPLCSAETGAAVEACAGDRGCIEVAYERETTPGVIVDTIYGPLEASCAGAASLGVYSCRDWQTGVCEGIACPGEYDAWVICAQDRPCPAERGALEACLEASPEYDECIVPILASCFAEP